MIRFINVKFVYIFLLLSIGIALIISCLLVSSGKPFWYDEIVSILLIKDNSLSHMLQAVSTGLDTTPPLFHVVGWFWTRFTNNSTLSLRILSSLGMFSAIIVVSVLLYRVYCNIWIAVGTPALTFLATRDVLYEISEARVYGLYMLLCALAILYFDVIKQQKNRVSWPFLILNTLIHSAIILTHYVGGFFSAAILVAFFVTDLLNRRLHFSIYSSIIASWIIFGVLWFPALYAHVSLTQVSTWIALPSVRSLYLTLRNLFPTLPIVLILAALVLAAFLFKLRNAPVTIQTPNETQRRIALRVLAVSVAVVPVGVWVASYLITPVFVSRYTLPALIGSTIIIADALSYILNAFSVKRLPPVVLRSIQLIGVVSILILVWSPINYGYRIKNNPTVMPGSQDSIFGYANLPVVMQSTLLYLPRRYYAENKEKYFYIIDWNYANDPQSNRSAFLAFKSMESLRQSYPDEYTTVVSAQEFLETHDHFIVLHDQGQLWKGLTDRWIELKFSNNPNYRTQVLGEVDGIQFVLVEKLQPILME